MAQDEVPFRGETVDDLQLPPALTVNSETILAKALEYSQTRRPLGYLDTSKLNASADLQAPAQQLMTKFRRRNSYQVITPGTSLEFLAQFLKQETFAIVTDTERRFVLAIVVREDLDKYIQRRYGTTTKT
ncbi:hypothetical protein CROQUDRAFT_166403 [Cronartium quercuum f. sp. fusiforme G11]|uniref:CBS domain-containing protein n=1 Tax=Cronartium quercuum f. sp. fusiforme G11 TaxID=708437 RepID=A0A9P6NCY0_9BASI|nr:hypothetical protein CROQUDRAFT_166403 [Cronartium quercuum f. sp. fusiforme G11]